MQTPYVAQLPIPVPTSDQRQAVEAVTCKLVDAKGRGPQVAEWEQELNALVYEVYGLTQEEIQVIENELASTRQAANDKERFNKATRALKSLRGES